MIGIYQERKTTAQGREDSQYIRVEVDLRDHLHLFSNGKNSNALAIFLKISLHMDAQGWAFPGRYEIQKSTGISSDAAIRAALKHLCGMQIDGQRILAMWRSRDAVNKQWGANLYRVYPDVGGSTTELPESFGRVVYQGRDYELVPWNDDPSVDDPPVDDLSVGDQPVGDRPLKNNQGEVQPITRKTNRKKTHGEENSPAARESSPPSNGNGHQAVKATTIQKDHAAAAEWDGAFLAFCEEGGHDPARLPPNAGETWRFKLREIGERWEASPGLVEKAIRARFASDVAFKRDEAWRTPWAAEDDIGHLILGYKSGKFQSS